MAESHDMGWDSLPWNTIQSILQLSGPRRVFPSICIPGRGCSGGGGGGCFVGKGCEGS